MVCPTIANRCWLSALIGMAIVVSSLLTPQKAAYEGDVHLKSCVSSDVRGLDSDIPDLAFSNESHTIPILESHHSELIEESEEKFFVSIALPVSTFISAWSAHSKLQVKFVSSNGLRSTVSLPLRC